MNHREFLFSHEYGTGSVLVYFRAESPREVKAKYPTLKYLAEEPEWITEELRSQLLTFDVDDAPSAHPFLGALDQAAQSFYASLGDQVRPPEG